MQVAPISPGPEVVRNLVQHLNQFLARLPATVGGERRNADRVAIPLLMSVAPAGEQEFDDLGSMTTAVGKDLSRGGIGFFHRDALPHRRVVLLFDDPRLDGLAVEVELNRCRFSNLGWYESGGRLLRLIQPGRSLAG